MSPVSILTQILRKEQQSSLSDNEPLLRFSFAKFLANPCGLMPSSLLHNDLAKFISNGKLDKFLSGSIKIMPTLQPAAVSMLSIVKTSKETTSSSLSQQALQFLEPFRQQYFVNQSLLTTEEREVITEEFLLIIQEVKHRANLLHSPKVRLYYSFFITS